MVEIKQKEKKAWLIYLQFCFVGGVLVGIKIERKSYLALKHTKKKEKGTWRNIKPNEELDSLSQFFVDTGLPLPIIVLLRYFPYLNILCFVTL